MNATTVKTKSQEVADDIRALLRARNPLIWIVTREEARVERYLFEAAMGLKYFARSWDIGAGVRDFGKAKFGTPALRDPGETLTTILTRATDEAVKAERCMWIMRDLPPWLSGPGGATTLRQLRNLARELPGTPLDRAQVVVVLSPSGDVPPELSTHATVIEWPLPDRTEIRSILDGALSTIKEESVRKQALPEGDVAAAVDAAVGLSGEEVAACYAKSLVQLRRIDPVTVGQEKKRVIARERVLEWHDPLPGGLESVGGLENLKAWLISRSNAYTPAARAYGLPAPKGVFLVGVQGCGKSMIAKAIATAWGVPLLRLDVGALKSKFVGESEANFRRALRVIESVGRCVVWIDEIEKALQGATSGSADGGVSADALGALLSWMQERTSEAFVVATANDIESLPPELYRKGRFDELFFVDLPSSVERTSIIAAALRAHGRDWEKLGIDITTSSINCEGFTGAEIAALIPEAMHVAFEDKEREITTADLSEAIQAVVPLSETAAEKLEKLRNWAKTRARSANGAKSADPTATPRGSARELDLGEEETPPTAAAKVPTARFRR